jgi:Crinkler effector protein N-terminal domain
VIQTAVALDPTQVLSLNCFLLGDDSDRMFTVEIPKNKNVNILKKIIKEEKTPHLDHIAASDLDLWQVSFPIDDLPSKNLATVGPKLRSEKFLSDAFRPELDVNRIHVFARAPGQGEYYLDSALILLIIMSRHALSLFRVTAICIQIPGPIYRPGRSRVG